MMLSKSDSGMVMIAQITGCGGMDYRFLALVAVRCSTGVKSCKFRIDLGLRIQVFERGLKCRKQKTFVCSDDKSGGNTSMPYKNASTINHDSFSGAIFCYCVSGGTLL